MRFEQWFHGTDVMYHAVDRVIAEGKTPWQHYLFFEHPVFGVTIAIDGDMQSCQADEGIYHEALVHPALFFHPNPKNVLIMGGGEGATAREILRHSGVERCVMVDIDGAFVEACRKYAPTWSEGAFDDPRLVLKIMDINDYFDEAQIPFDVVIGDLVDVADWSSPVAGLYSETFYDRLKKLLAPDAVVATQAGALDLNEAINHRKVRRSLAASFEHVASYGVVVPSFGGMWSYVVASDVPLDVEEMAKRAETSAVMLPAIGAENLAALFALPRRIARSLEK